jgi:hypothetical protein
MSSSAPPTNERAALDQLERIEAVVRAAPTPRVLWRARMLLDQLLRWREVEQAQREFGEIAERIHRHVRESGEPEMTDVEIQAEVDAVRAGRAGQSR